MGFWDFLNGTRTSGRMTDVLGVDATSEIPGATAGGEGLSYSWHEPNVTYLQPDEWAAEVAAIWSGIRSMSAAQMWKTQPHLRTVVGFLARNIAQVGIHTFERIDETDRVRSRDNDFARALSAPGDGMTSYRLLFALAADKLLYDRAYWLPYYDPAGTPRIRRIPPSWVTPAEKSAFGVDVFRVQVGASSTTIPATRLVEFSGYSPMTTTGCSPTIESLKDTLAESIEATKYRAQVWKRGGRTSSVIERPKDAPRWTPEQADRFREDWYANFTGDGPRAGGTPILEDGMVLKPVDFSAKDMEWSQGAVLAFSTVASAFHVNPTMVGILDNSNYSEVREFRRALYGDTLGPYFADFEAEINTFILPIFGVDPATFYAEFNIGEKLQGSFEEQAAVMSSAIGAPWMLRNEGRARMNLPSLGAEGDEMVTPLNVLIGGLASPRDTGSQNTVPGAPEEERAALPPGRKAVRVKARAPETFEAKAAQVIGAFFDRQARVVKTALGVKAGGDWWDEARWDRELSTDLNALAILITKEVASSTLKAIGFEPDVYDEDRTLAWLKEVSDRSATSLNATTKAKIEAALADGDDPDGKLAGVFDAQESRAATVAVSTVTLLSGFAAVEATKQQVGEDRATKTWVTGTNPRPDHEAMSGETVLLSEDFSNGAAWPGDGGALGADDLAGCNCELEINVPGGQS